MTTQDGEVADIFKGSEKIEIFGKLPAMLWTYIDAGRQLMDDLRERPDGLEKAVEHLRRILAVLKASADFLESRDLKERLTSHEETLGALSSGDLDVERFVGVFTDCLAKVETVAGHRPAAGMEGALSREALERELTKVEKIKTGRSPDVVFSIEILDDVRGYLAKEVMTEGITSILVIDNAGTLIVNMGEKLDLDVVGLAAVAAANFAATEQIARLIGERDFVLLFYKGHSESFHFCRVGAEYIIVTIFNNQLSLGLLRLKIAEVAQVLEKKLPKRQA